MTPSLDPFQQQWQAQNERLNEGLRLNTPLWLRTELQRARASMRGFRRGAVLTLVCGVLCLVGNGLFIRHHVHEPRFAIPAMALHLWLVGAVAASIAQFVQAGTIDYGAPVVEIQRRLEALHVLVLRSLRALFLSGLPIWFVPFLIVALRAWFGLDLYAMVGASVLLANLGASVVLGLALFGVCRRYAARLERASFARPLVRGLAGYSLTAAQDQLARLAAFERGDA